jgi:hypothetical protein
MGDPTLCDFSMPLSAVFYPLGFAVEVASNSSDVIKAAEASWGLFEKVACEPPIQLRVGVIDDCAKPDASLPFCRSQQNLITSILDGRNFIVSDLRRGFAFGWFSQATVDNQGFFRYHFLESAAFSILMSLHLTAIHAACVVLDRQGVLLCGESGAGKSSLAFACSRRGWTYVSDDASALVRSRSDRVVVGNPHWVRFRESATELFPDLLEHPLTRRINGEMAIELATRSLPEVTTSPQAKVDYVVFLNRRDDVTPTLKRVSNRRVLRHLEDVICYGETPTREAQRASLRNLLLAEAFELTYSDLDSAASRLEQMVREQE